VHSLSTALTGAGHEVYLLAACDTTDQKIRNNFGGNPYVRAFSLLETKDPTDAEVLREWRRSVPAILKGIEPDFVIMNGVLPVRMPYPSCAVSHDLEPHAYNDLLRRLMKMYCYRLHDRVVVTCSELRPVLARELRMREEAIAVIPTCIDPNRYQGQPWEGREAAILHMGMVGPKQPLATLAAFARVKEPALLYMTGFPGDDVRAAVARLPAEVRTRVHLLGVIEDAELKAGAGAGRSFQLCPAGRLADGAGWTGFGNAGGGFSLDQRGSD
jgi:hypothetical protein